MRRGSRAGVLALLATLVVAIVTLLRVGALARGARARGARGGRARARIDALPRRRRPATNGTCAAISPSRARSRRRGARAAPRSRRARSRSSGRHAALARRRQHGPARAAAAVRRPAVRADADRRRQARGAARREREEAREMRATVDEKLQATLEQRLGESFKHVSRSTGAGAPGPGRDADARGGRRRPEARADQREDARRLGRGAARRAARRGADAAAVRAQRRDASAAATSASSSRSASPAATTTAHRAGCRSTPSSRWRTTSGCRTRSSAPTPPPRTPRARRSPTSCASEARAIRDKYIEPPHTTDFAILFLPTEGLYAEMLARPGFADALQREFRVMLCRADDPVRRCSTACRWDSARWRSRSVRARCGACSAPSRPSSRKFGDVLTKTKDRLDKASEELEKAGVRRRALERQLRTVDALPESDAVRLLGTEGAFDAGDAPEK